MTRHGVAASADGDEEVVLARESDGVDDVGRSRAADDECRTALMHRVVNRLVGVSGVAGRLHTAANRAAELIECRPIYVLPPTICRRKDSCHGALLQVR